MVETHLFCQKPPSVRPVQDLKPKTPNYFVLLLAQPVNLLTLKLNPYRFSFLSNLQATATGWGATREGGNVTDVLQEVSPHLL
jgi:hypothetical protein